MRKDEKDFDIKEEIQKQWEFLYPFIIFCHPDRKEEIKSVMEEYKGCFSLYELKVSYFIDKNNIIVIDRQKMNNLAFVRGSSKSFVYEYNIKNTIFAKGGDE